MAKGAGERKGGGAAVEEQEQKLQAILLADSFNTNFRPISSDMPKVSDPVLASLSVSCGEVQRWGDGVHQRSKGCRR